MYDSLQGLDGVRIGDRVRVHVTALGDGDDNMALDIGAGRRVVALTSGERTSFDFVASEAGGVRVCSVAGDQAERGMTAQIVVTNQTAPWYQAAPVADRVHVIDMCAQEERWSDAPTCVYRRCTNATKSVGVVGPLIRVHVNDEVRVALSNNCSIAVGLTFAGLVATGGDDSVRVAPGAQTTLVYRVPDDAAGTSFLYRPPQPTLCGRGGESSLVGVCIVEREDPNESTAEQEQTDDDYDDVVIGLIGEQVNGVASNNTDDDSILLALPARATVRLHSFAHCSHRVTHLSIDDVWIDPARTALGDGAVRSLSLAMPFDGVRRLRFGNVSALFETRTAPTATVAVARERDAIANAPLRRVAASLVFTAAEQWAASASFGGDDSIDMGGDSSGAVVVLRMLSDERLEVRVRNDNASGAVALTFGGCLERTTGIASDASPIDVRFSDGRPTDVHVAAGGERTLHFVLAASLRAAFDANLTFSSYACLDRGALLVVTRRGAERGAADLAPRDVDREMVLVATATDINGVDNARFRVSQFQRARWYVGSRGATRAIVWHGAAVSDSPLRADDVLAVPVGTARTVDMVPDDVGEVHVHAGAEAELVVAAQAAPLDGAARRLDGIDVSLFHRHWGAAHSAFWRHTANPVLAQLPPVDDVVTFLMRSSPSVGTRRRPLVSQLLSAYINFLLADMVEVGAAAPQCVGDVCLAASRTAPSVARSDAAWRAGAARAGGGDFDRAPLERDPLPALLNLQTHWIDGSQIYGTSVEANRRLRTLSGGLLSTNVTLWPLRFASIQAIAVADLFVREHNRRAAALAVAHSGWSDEQLFGGARRLVVAEMQRIAVDELLPSLIGDTLPTYEHEPDVRGDVSTTFALACAPALMLGGTPARVELLNANLASVYASANGGDAAGSADAATLSTDACSGSPASAASCLAFGAEALMRGLFVSVAPAIDSSVGDRFPSLRVGNESLRRQSAPVDAATEWILRGREALLPSFAQLVRGRGATVPATMAELVGLYADANLTALVERAYKAAALGNLFDERPLVAHALEQLYPDGVEQLDAMVGLMVEPPETPLSSSVGPTLTACIRRQLHYTRNADRLWFQNGVVGLEELMPLRADGTTSSSLLRHLLVQNYDFEDKAAGSAHAFGTLGVPAGLEAARDAVTRFVSSIATFQGGPARAVRMGFHAGGTYEGASMRYGFAQGDCFVRSLAQSDTQNRGFERVPLEVMQLRNSADGALFVNMSTADLISLIGAVGATTASRGGLAMVWRRGRTDIGATTPEVSVCPMHGKLPDALVDGDDAFPHARTLDAMRAKFQRQGFNDRELVALLGGHSLGGMHESVSGFPNGVWTLRSVVIDNTYFRNLLPFAVPANRLLLRSTVDADKFAYRLAPGASSGEVGVTMLPSDVALLGDAATRDWVERYAADNALFQRDFACAFQRMLENGAAGVGTPLAPLPEAMDEPGDDDESPPVADDERELEADVLGAPPELPFFAVRAQKATTFVFQSDGLDGRMWQSISQPLPTLRVSFSGDVDSIHVLLETPTDSYVGLGFGPRAPGASMRGADVLIVSLNPDGTPLVRDAYALSDQLSPTPDVALNGSGSAWFNVHAERIGGLSRFWLSRARHTGDKWDNDVPASGLVETLFALGSVSLLDGDIEDVLSTYHGAQRAVDRMEWPVSPDELAQQTRGAVPGGDDELPLVGIVLGAVGGALALLVCAVACAVYFVRRQQRRDAEADGDEPAALVDGERIAVPAHAKACELLDAAFPLALVNPSAGLFRDPVPEHEYDEHVLVARRAAQQAQQAVVKGTRLLAVEEVFCDILQLRNVSRDWQDVALHLPPEAPQFRVAVEPATFRVAPDDVQAVKVSVLLTCTTKQRVTIKASAGTFVADLPTAKLEAELSTLLDFDEIHLIERIGEGSYGVVFAGTWRKQAVAVKMLRQQQFEEQEQADLRAEAKLLTQLLHRNIVQFRGAVFRESQCCLVTELAPHGSLKSVLTRFELPWDLVIKLCVDMASGVQFLHTSGIIHRDIKSDNVLVFSLSPRESVCAKLTDFGSARAGKAHIDAAGQIQLGSLLHFSANEGTPIYMAPQLFARTSRPSEASDVYSLGVLFYEVASEREPWADVPFSWNVAKLVMAGQRPTWPDQVVESAPAPFLPLVGAMWAQLAETRPPLDDVLQRLANCQEALGDRRAAFETRRNLLRSMQENERANNRNVLNSTMAVPLSRRSAGDAADADRSSSALSTAASSSGSVSFDEMSDEFNSAEELGGSGAGGGSGRRGLLSSSGRMKQRTGAIVPKNISTSVPQFGHLKNANLSATVTTSNASGEGVRTSSTD